MYARTCNGAVALDVLAAVCRAKARNFAAARVRARVSAAFAGYLA